MASVELSLPKPSRDRYLYESAIGPWARERIHNPIKKVALKLFDHTDCVARCRQKSFKILGFGHETLAGSSRLVTVE